MARSSLSGLKKQTAKDDALANDFIQGANTHSLAEQKISKAKYIRQTFSLTQDVSDQVDELLLRSKVARANRSIVVKTAIQQLGLLSDEALNKAVLETMGKIESE